MTEIIYFLTIEPIKLMLELIFSIMYRVFGNVGISIVAVSIAVNFLILPMYKKSDAMQEEEREKQKQMSHWVEHIRRTFKGDERFMMLSAYYKEQSYQPIYALRGSLTLLLQIPFFIAAYRYLSSLTLLNGCSFGMIHDLSKPDQILKMGSVAINVLPILMTLINFISGYIYTRGAAAKEKIQIYVLGTFFLIFLYGCPSGLVLYWTLNNTFSLLKNIFMKIISNPQKIFSMLTSIAGVFVVIGAFIGKRMITTENTLVVLLLFVIMQIPLVAFNYHHSKLFRKMILEMCNFLRKRVYENGIRLYLKGEKFIGILLTFISTTAFIFIVAIGALTTTKRVFLVVLTMCLANIPSIHFLYHRNDRKKIVLENIKTVSNQGLYVMNTLFLTILLGVMIPLSIISASPTEFVSVYNYVNPLYYIATTGAISAGVFCVWGSVVFQFAKDDTKRKLSLITSVFSICFVLNYLFFGNKLGNISSHLTFDKQPSYTHYDIYQNLIVNIIVILVVTYVFYRKKKILYDLIIVLVVSAFVMSGLNCTKVNKVLNESEVTELAKRTAGDDNPILQLDQKGKNVIVIMLDRAIGAYVLYIMEEKPELKECYRGFTYYPNTISFGPQTNFASPALFGGYEYTPQQINHRDKESLKDKQNEALKVMPVLFSQNDFDVTVCDPPYAGYQWRPDLSIYDNYEGIRAINTEIGQYFHLLSKEEIATVHPNLIKRNFFYYSIFKTAPLLMQKSIYDKGNYNSTTNNSMNIEYLYHFSFLKNLSRLTKVEQSERNQFIMIQNSATHEPVVLHKPDYLASLDTTYQQHNDDRTIDGITMRMSNETEQSHYDVNMAALMQLANWITYMKANDVYNNTRIIITSDHGKDLNQFDNMVFNGIDVEYVNPLLMVKDFNSSEEFSTSSEFMTNGDVPTIAVEDIIEKPINPFTGNIINNMDKTNKKQVLTLSGHFDIFDDSGKGNVFNTSDSPWYSVHDNIFMAENWENLGMDYVEPKASVKEEK